MVIQNQLTDHSMSYETLQWSCLGIDLLGYTSREWNQLTFHSMICGTLQSGFWDLKFLDLHLTIRSMFCGMLQTYFLQQQYLEIWSQHTSLSQGTSRPTRRFRPCQLP